jgi:penicillin-binding protein 2
VGRENGGIIPNTQTINPVNGSARSQAINAAIGQGEVNVTPLQQAVAYAAVANGGTVWKPQIVRRIEAPDGRMIREFQPEPNVNNGHGGKLDVKPEFLTTIREGLFAVVNEPGGTGYRSRLQEMLFAGKTGTAQVMKLGQKQKLDPATVAYFSRDHAWFAAYAPADDPEIVVVVLNEHGGWGADAAAPVASRIVRAWARFRAEDAAQGVAMKAVQ